MTDTTTCPTCGSDDQKVRLSGCFNGSPHGRQCDDPFHDAPTDPKLAECEEPTRCASRDKAACEWCQRPLGEDAPKRDVLREYGHDEAMRDIDAGVDCAMCKEMFRPDEVMTVGADDCPQHPECPHIRLAAYLATIEAEYARLKAIEDAARAWMNRGVKSPLSLARLDANLNAALNAGKG